MDQLYSLALALVPDADVAGDLFMRARDEDHLVRLAAAWRRAQGLPPMNPPFSLPELSPQQQEHAGHLARRGRLRRRVLATMGAAGAVAAILLAGLWVTREAPKGLATAAVFKGAAVSEIPSASGVTFSVYKVQAQPGSVMVWWDLKGPDVANVIRDLSPELFLGTGTAWLKPAATETAVVRRDRVVARTVYRVYVTTANTAVVRAPGIKGSAGESTHEVPLDRSALGENVTISANQAVTQGPVTLTIKSVSLSPLETTVRYTGQTPPGTALPTIVAVDHKFMQMQRIRMAPRRQEGGLYVQTFPPLSGDATDLVLVFSAPIEPIGALAVRLPSPLLSFTATTGSQRVAALNLPPGEFPGPDQPFAVDEAGRQYLGAYTTRSGLPSGAPAAPSEGRAITRERRYDLAIAFTNLPPQANLVAVTLPNVQRAGSRFDVRIDLTRP